MGVNGTSKVTDDADDTEGRATPMKQYAVISGSDETPARTYLLVEDDDGIEVVSDSETLIRSVETAIRRNGYKTVAQYVNSISYFNVQVGDIDAEAEGKISRVRTKFQSKLPLPKQNKPKPIWDDKPKAQDLNNVQ